ncbi:ribosomal protein L7/L12 [Streptomyces sp. NPDC097619]|uniref:ribosomal protein L7/L12 n=1 Tax=Streptomyces sp. NPDC097619 TaxID=3157228 RepID=UPI003324F375
MGIFVGLVVVLAVVGAVSSVSGALAGRIHRLERQNARLERRLDLLMTHLGIEERTEPGMAEVRALLLKGRKIEAIKEYRRLTGAGLREAKEAVEAMER